jgi:hypothetical protein
LISFVSDPSLASLTTDEDNVAILTAIAAGQFTRTASAEGIISQEQVTILSQSSFTSHDNLVLSAASSTSCTSPDCFRAKIKKPKSNGASTKLSSIQKPCEKMTEAIVMDGAKRG